MASMNAVAEGNEQCGPQKPRRSQYAILPTSEMPVALAYSTRARGRRCCSASTHCDTLVPPPSLPVPLFFALCASSNTMSPLNAACASGLSPAAQHMIWSSRLRPLDTPVSVL